MSKVAVVYWSGTGNTQAMAEAVVSGAQAKGADVTLYSVSDFDASLVEGFDAIAFGCPAMGAEELEESEFEPVFAACNISGKKVALFGSYGWGDGEWMRTWEDRCKEAGANIVCESVICNDAPDDDAVESCKKLGEAVAA
ncbi:MAG: flavodoxin [Clostridia bacterium]|nr:flavodoxin [Clostridia bacterium]